MNTLNATLAGQHAVVTGGGSGIGAAVAQALLRAGARVTLMGRNAERISDYLQLPCDRVVEIGREIEI